AGAGEGDAVEPLGDLDQRLDPAMAHVVADRPHLLQGGLDVELGAGQQVARIVGGAAQVDSGDHAPSVEKRTRRARFGPPRGRLSPGRAPGVAGAAPRCEAGDRSAPCAPVPGSCPERDPVRARSGARPAGRTLAAVTEALPLFPLNSVLFPGLVLPLHVFEERYRRLVADLVAGPEPRRFGVVAIRDGREVAPTGPDDGAPGPLAGLAPDPFDAVFDVGCVAEIATVQEQPDGRYELIATGTTRFRV